MWQWLETYHRHIQIKMRRKNTKAGNTSDSIKNSPSASPSPLALKKRKLLNNVQENVEEDVDSDATDATDISCSSMLSSISDKSCRIDLPNMKPVRGTDQDKLIPIEVSILI